MLSKTEPELDGKKPQPIHMAKNENTCSEENSEGMAEQPFDKRDPGCGTWT